MRPQNNHDFNRLNSKDFSQNVNCLILKDWGLLGTFPIVIGKKSIMRFWI